MLIHIPEIGLKEIRPGQVIESEFELDCPYLKDINEPVKRKRTRKVKDITNGEHRSTENHRMG